MKFTKSFYIKLVILMLPVLGLFLWPILQSRFNSIGGGGYDLTNLYAGTFILIYIIIWNVLILISLIINFYKKKSVHLNEDKSLVIFGLSLFTLSLIILTNTWFN